MTEPVPASVLSHAPVTVRGTSGREPPMPGFLGSCHRPAPLLWSCLAHLKRSIHNLIQDRRLGAEFLLMMLHSGHQLQEVEQELLLPGGGRGGEGEVR